MTEKQQLAVEIGQLEGQVTQKELELQRWRDQASRVQVRYVIGVIGLIVGVSLCLVFVGIRLYIGVVGGVLISVVGLWATITGLVNRGRVEKTIEGREQDLVVDKARLAELKARLLV